MASAGFMFLTANGEAVHGESTITSMERENSIPVVELVHDVAVPTDVVSGGRSGRREHSPIKVTAAVDKALPKMYQAWANNMRCEVQIKFFRPTIDGSGSEEMYFEIDLANARISTLKLHWPSLLERGSSTVPEHVEYAFTYETITWKHLEGNLEFEDRWRTESP